MEASKRGLAADQAGSIPSERSTRSTRLWERMAHARVLGGPSSGFGTAKRQCKTRKGRTKASEDGRCASADNGRVVLPFALPFKNTAKGAAGTRGDANGTPKNETQQEKRERRWKAWEQWFDQVLEEENRLHGLQEEVDAAVEEENYALAAKIQEEIQAIKGKDPVGQILEDMKNALQQERYEEAARLRDHACLGLLGWWVGKSGNDDPQGLLLKISAEYGRLVGSAYTGKDLSEIQEAKDSGVTFMEEPSQPVLEIFIKKDSRTRTGFATQVVGLVSDGKVEEEDDEEEEEEWVFTGTGDEVTGTFMQGNHKSVYNVKLDLSSEDAVEASDFDLDALDLEQAFSPVSAFTTQRKPASLSQPGRDEFRLCIEGIPEKQSGMLGIRETFEFPTAKEIHRASAQFTVEKEKAAEKPSLSTSKDAKQWAWVAEQIRKLSEQADNRGENDLAEALQDVADKMLSEGLPESSQVKDFSNFSFSPELGSRTMFRRLNTSYPSTDPFSGLYVGTYGPHGPEVVQIRRGKCQERGDECIFATKLTGDTNIPSGSLTFKARIDRNLRLDHHGIYPEELGIVARYKGEGRVARSGHTDPRWVEGELLLLDGKGGPLTGDAELGFVWSVPGERKFLILFNRLHLD